MEKEENQLVIADFFYCRFSYRWKRNGESESKQMNKLVLPISIDVISALNCHNGHDAMTIVISK